tara:strand:+ start:15845 stop:17803 length:1959 start_codon:yes stop_codon:yes gene_type:complete
MSNFTLNQLTEGIRSRHMGAQHQRLTEKWNRTGLLRGLQTTSRENMAVLLENQAAQLLRETNTLGTSGAASGDVRGFQNIAFPIVRRVFGGLVANDLVSIQPMSLPSGLLFYLDYTYGSAGGESADDGASSYTAGQSIYNSPTGKGVQSGSLAVGGQYDLAGSGFSRVHENIELSGVETQDIQFGIINQTGKWEKGEFITSATQLTGASGRFMGFDPQVTTALENGDISQFQFLRVPVGMLTGSAFAADLTMIKDVAVSTPAASTLHIDGEPPEVIPAAFQSGTGIANLRRLNQLVSVDASTAAVTSNPLATTGTANAYVLMSCFGTGSQVTQVSYGATGDDGALDGDANDDLGVSFVIGPVLNVGSDGDSLTIPAFESNLAANGASVTPVIPEIDIKIESLSVTAVTRKLRARWSPELAQDLNAYHSLDAEVELTQILSEQIALELDREILNDLLTQANGANFYWSRAPGKFVNKETGAAATRASTLHGGPAFTGTVREWYETLIETIIDAANTIHRKTLRGSANFVVVGPDVATILESSILYKPNFSLDGDGQVGAGMSIGAEKVGQLSNRFTVYKDPYFPRNKILLGYKGGSYLETGYVYAPYVPLIVTPTIFAPEDFTPRKGVMTRYGKKMVRSDFYGTVTCLDMNII